jgi:phosphinothricin acetyltransferase
VLIRDADSGTDAAGCAAIYAPAVADGVASLEQRPPTEDQMRRRIAAISVRYPWLVAEQDGTVLGYAYASQHRERWAYQWAADTTVYVDPSQHRRGLGRALYGALLPLLVRQGLYVACAGITLPNPASVGLHESFGFEPVGVYPKVGFKHGRWWGVGWWLARLREQLDGEMPAEPGPPVRLEDAAPCEPGPPVRLEDAARREPGPAARLRHAAPPEPHGGGARRVTSDA